MFSRRFDSFHASLASTMSRAAGTAARSPRESFVHVHVPTIRDPAEKARDRITDFSHNLRDSRPDRHGI
jgi:hypothetical protein